LDGRKVKEKSNGTALKHGILGGMWDPYTGEN